jgi:hypothetical protein
VLFPAVDTLSVFPLMANTLGNNIAAAMPADLRKRVRSGLGVHVSRRCVVGGSVWCDTSLRTSRVWQSSRHIMHNCVSLSVDMLMRVSAALVAQGLDGGVAPSGVPAAPGVERLPGAPPHHAPGQRADQAP